MTYASENPEKLLGDMVRRMDVSDPELMTGEVNCPGKWVLYSALRRTEAGAFFKLGGYPRDTGSYGLPWKIVVGEAPELTAAEAEEEQLPRNTLSQEAIGRLKQALSFQYAHGSATRIPSKQTATQLKGRQKDMEAAENTARKEFAHELRVPSFVKAQDTAVAYGTALHLALQHITYAACDTPEGVDAELKRLVQENYLTEEMYQKINKKAVFNFFASPLGVRLRNASCVLREFKFSVLTEAEEYYDNVPGEKLLLQGVVDCAIVEDDGIIVLDFKTDRIWDGNIETVADRYVGQVKAYANALSRIYEKPVKEAYLYFFSAEELYTVAL